MKWRKKISIMLSLCLLCTSLYGGNLSRVHAQEGEDASAEVVMPYDEVYVIDDADSPNGNYEGKEYCRIEYSEGWHAEDGENGGSGAYNNTDHWNETKGATCTITFTGTNLKFYTRIAGNLGWANFSIDSGEAVEVNFWSQDKRENVLLYDTGILDCREHVLTITAKDVVVVDRVEVSCPYAIINDTDGGNEVTEPLKIHYKSGTWNYQGPNFADDIHGHSYDQTQKPYAYLKNSHWVENGTIEVQFYGTSVKYYGEKKSNSGETTFSIDGESIVEDLVYKPSGGSEYQALIFDSNSNEYDVELNPNKLHTLTVQSNEVLVVDRIEVCCTHKGEETEVRDAKAATCTETGYSGDSYWKYCGRESSKGNEIPATGHSWDEGEVTKEPTETEEGEKTYTCTVCGATDIVSIDKGCQHTNVEVLNEEATCTEDGYSERKHCTDCDRIISEGTVIEKLGHDPELRDAKEASGTEDGYTGDTYCKRCDELLQSGKAIPKAYAVVNDATTGAEVLQFNFSRNWTYEKKNSSADCYEGDNHWSLTKDAAVEFVFNGTSVKYYGEKGGNLGIAAFSIDGGEEEMINMYQPGKQDQVLIYQSDNLEPGVHTLKVRVTGEKGGGSDCVVVADRIEVYCNHENEATEVRTVEATCTKQGCIGGTYGKICGQWISGGETIDALGHDETVEEAVEPTCTMDGYLGATYCKRCDEVLIPRTAQPALGHERQPADKEATCTEAGCTGKVICARCEEVIEAGEEIPAQGHTWDEGTVTKQPTETEQGEKLFTCTVCQSTRTQPIPVIGGCQHTNQDTRTEDATCTEPGRGNIIYCTDCETILYEGDEIPAKGHDPELRDEIEESSTEDGYTGDTWCKRCKQLIQRGKAIPKAYAVVNDAVVGTENLQFNFTEGWNYEKKNSSAECYEGDNHWSEVADAVLTFKFIGTAVKYYGQKARNLGIAAFSIDNGVEKNITMYAAQKENQVLIYQAKNLEPGEHILKVRVTGEKGEGNGTVIVADRLEVYCDHEGEGTDVRDIEATCTEAGYTGGTYGKVCGQLISGGETIPAKGHTWDEGTVTKQPTETEEGEKTFTCTVCQTTKTESIPVITITPCQHTNTATRTEEATCTEPGHKDIIYCTDCGEILYEGDEIAALEHSWNKGVITKQPTASKTGIRTFTCSVCKTTRTETVAKLTVPRKGSTLKDTSSKASYQVLTAKASNGKITGTVAYKGTTDKSAKTITIPEKVTIAGAAYTVTAVADKAFQNNKKITKVVIGSNVTTIGDNTFSGCTKLKTVTIGKNVTTIGTGAFNKCTALTKITIPSKVKKISKQAFYGCKKLKSITIKTTKLTKSSVGSKSFQEISAKAVIKVPKSKLKSYSTMLKTKGIGKKVKIKK